MCCILKSIQTENNWRIDYKQEKYEDCCSGDLEGFEEENLRDR